MWPKAAPEPAGIAEGGGMRRVTLGRTGIETSCLGFGCASLGSRVGAEAGARALAAAIDAGVTWVDLAPPYGDGRAEDIAAPVLRAHRDKVQLCTKAGIGLAAGAGGRLRQTLGPLARRVLAAAGPLGARLRGAAPQANTRLPLTPALLTGSLEASLRRLGIDHVDLFALHGPDPAEVGRDDIRRALENLRTAGKTRAVAVAGDAPAAEAALAAGDPYGVVQLPLPAPGEDARLLARVGADGCGLVTHSVLGAGGPPAALRHRIAAAAGVAAEGPDPARLMVERAFALNPEGVVLVSMFSAGSRAANLAAAARDPAASDPLASLGGGA
jgi:aryl-alcohol dehydrogenase-like predicted oxidoreductase